MSGLNMLGSMSAGFVVIIVPIVLFLVGVYMLGRLFLLIDLAIKALRKYLNTN